jgi:NitT/TauT family transport system permease protein
MGRNAVPPLAVALGLLAGWQALALAAGADTLSTPAATAATLARLMSTQRFWSDAAATFLAFAAAVALSIVLGIATGVALGLSRGAEAAVEPLLLGFHSLPKVTLYPLVLLGFGLGLPAKIAFGVMHGLVPIAVLTRTAIAAVAPVHRRTGRVLRLGRAALVRWVVLPAILPDLVAAIRIGASLSLLGVLIGEMFAAKRGLGYAAVTAMGLGDIRTILAIGLFLAVIAVAANIVLLALERRLRRGAD